jgi:hypothetical protein
MHLVISLSMLARSLILSCLYSTYKMNLTGPQILLCFFLPSADKLQLSWCQAHRWGIVAHIPLIGSTLLHLFIDSLKNNFDF